MNPGFPLNAVNAGQKDPDSIFNKLSSEKELSKIGSGLGVLASTPE